jgi:apolipoprotein N-acyltransferase
LWGLGSWRLAQPLPDPRGVALRLVQPNAAQSAKWDEAEAMAFLERQLAFTAATPRPDLVIWPETAVPFTFEISPGLKATIAEAGQGVPVALGIQRIDGDRGWNSLRVVLPDATLGPSYDKHHLVPFGEYVPFGDLAYSLFGITAFAAQTGRTYSAGTGPAVLDLGPVLGRVLPLICYEVVFPGIPRRAPERADWMLQITNDAWFGTWSGPFQHVEQARLRAIEQGLPLVRVANTGVTAVFDARGQQTAALDFGVASYLDADLPGALPATAYARWGDWPVLGLMLGGLLAAMRRQRRPVA